MWEEEVTGDEGYGGAFVKYGTDYIYTTNYLGDEYSAGILQAAQLVGEIVHLTWYGGKFMVNLSVSRIISETWLCHATAIFYWRARSLMTAVTSTGQGDENMP